MHNSDYVDLKDAIEMYCMKNSEQRLFDIKNKLKMINDLQIIADSQNLYDLYPTNNSCPVGELIEEDSQNKRHYVSSLCFQLKKKIKRQQNRPSVLKIEDSGRNVKIYQITPSSNNLEKIENETQ